jgi:hypothetical protein
MRCERSAYLLSNKFLQKGLKKKRKEEIGRGEVEGPATF